MSALPGLSRDAEASLLDAALHAWREEPLRLSAAVGVVGRAIPAGRFDLALRFADRARRLSPDSPTLCHIALSLAMQAGEADQALRMFRRIARDRINADLAALHVDALRLSGRGDDAASALHAYLGRFAVQPEGPLDRAARALHSARGGEGWAGLTPELRLIGEGARLADCAATLPTDFGLSGTAEFDGRSIDGAVALDWLPTDMPPRLILRRGRREHTVAVTRDEERPGRFRFAILWRRAFFRTPEQVDLLVELPDGRRLPLPGSPVRLGPVRPYRARGRRHAASAFSDGTAIVIPVYRGETETRACIDSVLATVSAQTPVVLVNDASPEPGVTRLLRSYAADGRVILIENEANLGFPAAVNRGMAAVDDHDVVLLNADAIVFPGWQERLRAHADADPCIATVTPLSNAGSIASYPGGAETPCDRNTAHRRDRLAARVNAGECVDAPTGVGFCMFVRRACLKQVGAFDETLFGRGYGEENDFSMRAAAHGWRHVIAADVYVLHRGGASFGSARDGLRQRNAALLSARHPGYDAAVAAFEAAQPLAPLRRRLDGAALRENRRRRVLLVSHGLGGGVGRHVEARMRMLTAEGFLPLLMHPVDNDGGAVVTACKIDEFHDLRFGVDEAEICADLLRSLDLDRVELHHFLGLDEAFVDGCFALGAPVDIYLHDFSLYCPRLTLLGADGGCCREPGGAACRDCVDRAGSELHDALDPDALRARSRRWLAQARTITAPCRDSAKRHERMFPDATIRVAAWEDTARPPIVVTPAAGPPWRIATIGAIGEQKGQSVLLDCAAYAADCDLPLEFGIIGFAADEEALLRTGNMFVTGRYEPDELPTLLRREAPHAIFLPSLTPETWSYALSEAMATGLPVVAFDIGAIAERLRASTVPHRLIPPNADIAEIDALLLAVASGKADPPRLPLFLHTSGASIMRDSGDAPTPLAEMLTLARGVYRFSIEGGEGGVGADGLLPALRIMAAPGQAEGAVECIAPPARDSRWLRGDKDSVVLQVRQDRTQLLVLLMTQPGLAPLRIDVRRLDEPVPAVPPPLALPGGGSPIAPAGAVLVRSQIVVHAEYVGDVIGMDGEWAGAVEANRAMECLTITPVADIAPAMLEYCVLNAAGLETGWVEQGQPCGTRGMALPLLGFAIRQRPHRAQRIRCEYSGRFASGRVVGPLRDGEMCRSPDPNDRLVGVWFHLIDVEAREVAPPESAAAPTAPAGAGPRFSVLHDIPA